MLWNKDDASKLRHLFNHCWEEDDADDFEYWIIREQFPDDIPIDVLKLPHRILPGYREVEEIEIDPEIPPDAIDKSLKEKEYSHPYEKGSRENMDISLREFPHDEIEENIEEEDVEEGGEHS